MRLIQRRNDIILHDMLQSVFYLIGKDFEAEGQLDEAITCFLLAMSRKGRLAASSIKDLSAVYARQSRFEEAVQFLLANPIKGDIHYDNALRSFQEAATNVKKGMSDPLCRSVVLSHNCPSGFTFSFRGVTDVVELLPNLAILIFRSATSARNILKTIQADFAPLFLSADRLIDLLCPSDAKSTDAE